MVQFLKEHNSNHVFPDFFQELFDSKHKTSYSLFSKDRGGGVVVSFVLPLKTLYRFCPFSNYHYFPHHNHFFGGKFKKRNQWCPLNYNSRRPDCENKKQKAEHKKKLLQGRKTCDLRYFSRRVPHFLCSL